VSFVLGCMNACVLALLVVVASCGCSTPPSGAPTDVGDGFRRENHPAFTAREQAIASAARRYIEQVSGKRLDAYYRVRHIEDGYSVLVFPVSRYVHNQPMFGLHRDWIVRFSEDGTVIKVLR